MNTKLTADQAFVRETNLSLVLRLIHSQAPISRAQVALMTGLNKSTVSSLVDELLAKNLVHEIGNNIGGAGRPAMMLEVNAQAGNVIGAELGVDFVSVAVTDFMGNILWRKREEADTNVNQVKMINQTLQIVKEAIKFGKKKNQRTLGLGLTTPGTVNINEGVLIFAPNLHWRNVPFGKIFAEQTKLPVYVENDANAAAVAEHLFGTARQVQDFLFVFSGVGIGGGLFLNGKLYRGKNGYAGEIGHFPIMAEPYQTVCHCGNRGCWETYANQYSIIQRVQARLEVKRSSIIPKLMAEQNSGLTIPLIKQAADAGDKEAIDSFAEAGLAMGQGFAGLINIFNPKKMILGGPLSIAGEYLLPNIIQAVKRHSMPEISQQAEIVLSKFGPDASLIGAIAIVVDDALTRFIHFGKK
ncbi:MAG: ROK family transcriptional regulator [Anaerolineales bacterium]|nr:ROK family transcriptional regulator [Anaerolineales bacterium]MBX3037923.1 ROK family transcriptional regulator [Anaerolineales bacterium]